MKSIIVELVHAPQKSDLIKSKTHCLTIDSIYGLKHLLQILYNYIQNLLAITLYTSTGAQKLDHVRYTAPDVGPGNALLFPKLTPFLLRLLKLTSGAVYLT